MSRQNPSPTLTLVFRISVTSSLTTRAEAILAQLPSLGIQERLNLKIINLYFVEGKLPPESLHKISQTLLSDPVTDQYNWQPLGKDRVTAFNPKRPARSWVVSSNREDFGADLPGLQTIEVLFNVANELVQAAHRLGFKELRTVATGTCYKFSGEFSDEELHRIAKSLLINDTNQCYTLGEIQPEFVHGISAAAHPEKINLSQLDDDSLSTLSAERRLALDLNEMRIIQDYFQREERPATDAELETIAQTWSEHCVHKTFRALIAVEGDKALGNKLTGKSNSNSQFPNYQIDNLFKTYLRSATEEINAPWVHSTFVDNAGVIEFDDETDISFKVETHNHPSAIEPFGGANTGTGGVVRDVLGVSHRPIAATDVLCFGPADLPHDKLPEGVLRPTRIRSGVVAGIEDYGNKLGLPTVNGAAYYHEL